MELNKEEKIYLLSSWIEGLQFHINELTIAIEKYPNSDILGKQPRSEVLNQLINKQTFYKQELQALQSNA